MAVTMPLELLGSSEDALKSQSQYLLIQSSIESELRWKPSTDLTTRESVRRRKVKQILPIQRKPIFLIEFCQNCFAFADLITTVQGPLEYQDQYYVLSCLHKRNASQNL